MKRYEFTLDKVREYKTQILSREKSVLMSLNAELAMSNERMEELVDEHNSLGKEITESVNKGVSASMLMLLDSRRKAVRADISALDTKIALLEASVERQKGRVAAVKQEVSGLDRLEEKQLEEYEAIVKKEQEQVIAEFINARLVREKEIENA